VTRGGGRLTGRPPRSLAPTVSAYRPRVGFLAKLLLGSGTLKPDLRAALESEGFVRIEEGLTGSVRYEHFRAPGRYHHGKITGVRVGLGISEQRIVVYSHSGRAKLVDTRFADPRATMLDVALDRDDRVAIGVDYDRGDVPKVSGQITIMVRTPDAATIVEELRARLDDGRRASADG